MAFLPAPWHEPAAMPRPIDYFLSLSSPWAYLGHAALMDIARRHDLAVSVRPMPVRQVFDATGGLPLPKRHPARQRYRLVELQRWRARRGLPLNPSPRHSPFDAALLDRTVIAIVSGGGDPDAFMRRAFAGIWAEDRDLADALTLAELLEETGHDSTTLLDAAGGEAAARLYEANRDAAIALDAFGVPAYVLDGEVFWGQDRLELLDEALASGRGPLRA